ncbi:MAG: bifunctional glycosyltransferase family 2/GtrA family protein [Clostridia bacterium]|nr:bifunctional glycosyltransferase family 2/GtrA family protein [Clostridia bacterium]
MSRPNTVIIPAYRPDTRLIRLAADVLDLGYSVIVVNDGSGDAYDLVFRALDPRVIQLRHEKNCGKGAGIKTGLAYVLEQNQKTDDEFDRIRLVGIMDADGQHRPADMERVMSEAEEHPVGMTLGVREVNKKMPLRSRFGNAVTRWLFHMLTKSKVSDTQTGLRVFPAELIPELLRVEGDRYEYEMSVLAFIARRRLGFTEVPIATLYEDKQNSTSHFRVIRDSLLVYKGLFKFAGSSLISFLVDYLLFILLIFLLRGLSASEVMSFALIANILARLVSGTVNYLLNCRYVFHRRPSPKTAGEYALLAITILIVNTGILYLWKLTPLPITVCKLFTEICMFLANYLVQKKLIFKKKSRGGGDS